MASIENLCGKTHMEIRNCELCPDHEVMFRSLDQLTNSSPFSRLDNFLFLHAEWFLAQTCYTLKLAFE